MVARGVTRDREYRTLSLDVPFLSQGSAYNTLGKGGQLKMEERNIKLSQIGTDHVMNFLPLQRHKDECVWIRMLREGTQISKIGQNP